MKSIERKYGSQINVIFYDIWTEEQKKYAKGLGSLRPERDASTQGG